MGPKPDAPIRPVQQILIQTVPGQKLGEMSVTVAIQAALACLPLNGALSSVLMRDVPPSALLKLKARQEGPASPLGQPMPEATIEVKARRSRAETVVCCDQEIPRKPSQDLRLNPIILTDSAQMQGRNAEFYKNSTHLFEVDGSTCRALTVPEQLGFMADAAAAMINSRVDVKVVEQVMEKMVQGLGVEYVRDGSCGEMIFVNLPGRGKFGSDYTLKPERPAAGLDATVSGAEYRALRADLKRNHPDLSLPEPV